MDKIKDTRNWQVSIKDPAAIVEGGEDIAQCVYIILTTIPGSDPLRPSFGSNVFQYLDKPLTEVKSNIIYAATTAIERWEKRIEVTSCTVSRNDDNRYIIKIEGTVVASANQLVITSTILNNG